MRIFRSHLLVMVSAAAALTLGVGAPAVAQAARPSASPPTARETPLTSTVRYLLGQLSVDEKIQLVHGSLGEGITAPETPT